MILFLTESEMVDSGVVPQIQKTSHSGQKSQLQIIYRNKLH